MMKIIFLSMLMLFHFYLFAQEPDSLQIIDKFEAEIECSSINMENSRIVLFDTIKYDSIKGLAEFQIIFDNVDSLNVIEVDLRTIIFLQPERIIIKSNEAKFEYYKDATSPFIENLKCKRKEEDSRKIFLTKRDLLIPLIVYPCGNIPR